MRKLCAALLVYLGLASAALAQNSVFVPATTASIPITISTATTTKLVTNPGNTTGPAKSIYVTAIDIIAAGSGNIQFIAGTGATCGTGTVNITGNYNLTAGVGFTKGTGNGVVWVVPPGLDLCAVSSAAVNLPGSLAYGVF
jgi:hypothetical protein